MLDDTVSPGDKTVENASALDDLCIRRVGCDSLYGLSTLLVICTDAAQGQDQGEIGDSSSNHSGENAIANVDFVRAVPGDSTYSTKNQARYHLNFKAYWNSGSGTMTVGNYNNTDTSPASIVSASNQKSIIIWNNAIGQSIYYNGQEKSQSFITAGGN